MNGLNSPLCIIYQIWTKVGVGAEGMCYDLNTS